jgi:hypothetical protein
MTKRAVAHFDVTSWNEAPYDGEDGGVRLSRADVTKTFRGDLEGESTALLLMCQADPKDLDAGGGFVASEKVIGQLDGRDGSFVMQHGGIAGASQERRTFGHVVPGTGTDDLAGLSGTVELSIDADGRHTLTLDYEITM